MVASILSAAGCVPVGIPIDFEVSYGQSAYSEDQVSSMTNTNDHSQFNMSTTIRKTTDMTQVCIGVGVCRVVLDYFTTCMRLD